MQMITSKVSEAWTFIYMQLRSMTVTDAIDIALVAILLFYVYKFIRERRAGKLAVGVFFLIALQLFSSALNFNTMSFLLQNIFQVGLIALIIVFQPELRSVLEKMGSEPLKSLKSIGEGKDSQAFASAIKELCDAVTDMSADKTGALIVIERSTRLGDVIKSGIVINSDLSSFLIKNIFFNKAPLHDGAMIIRGGRIHAAGCFLPLSSNTAIINDLGTRHRAGIGMSENSDAIVIIVSEETGNISMAVNGQLRRNYDYLSLKHELESLLSETSVKKKSSHFKRDSKKAE